MIRVSFIALAAAAMLAVGSSRAGAPAQARRLSDHVEVEPLADGVWLLRTTYVVEKWGLVPANGLAVVSGKEAFLVDPGWDDGQAEMLVAWARDVLRAERIQALVTHAHGDRIGGIRALLARGVSVIELALTAEIASGRGYPPPTRTFDRETRIQVGSLSVQAVFPGAGHTADNVVAFVPERHILFGGCLVKETAARDLGNVADAYVGAWPASVAVLKTRFPDATLVVPGHGAPGGMALLDHTAALAGAASRRSR